MGWLRASEGLERASEGLERVREGERATVERLAEMRGMGAMRPR